MPFEKGKNKTGGRAKGTPNALTNELRDFVKDILEDNQSEFSKRLNALDNEGFCRIYLRLLEFNLPKLREVSAQLEPVKPVYYKLPDGTIVEW